MYFNSLIIVDVRPLSLCDGEHRFNMQPSIKHIFKIKLSMRDWNIYLTSFTCSITFISQCNFFVCQSKAATCPFRPPNRRCLETDPCALKSIGIVFQKDLPSIACVVDVIWAVKWKFQIKTFLSTENVDRRLNISLS